MSDSIVTQEADLSLLAKQINEENAALGVPGQRVA